MTNTDVADLDAKKTKSGRTTLIMILVVALLPVVLAYTMFFSGVGVPENTVNKGELIEAISLENVVDAETWQRIQEDKKWRLLLPVGKTCNEACESNYYTTRQVHVRLGEKGVRIERIALNYGGEYGRAYLDGLAETHPQLRSVTVDSSVWDSWSESLEAFKREKDSHFYMLVDQEGKAMMVYTDQHGNDLLKDIKRALKYSIDYQ